MDKTVFADQSQKCCSTSGAFPGLPVLSLTIENFAELTGTVSVTSVVKASQLDGSTAEDEREKVKTDLSKLKAKIAGSLLLKKKKSKK